MKADSILAYRAQLNAALLPSREETNRAINFMLDNIAQWNCNALLRMEKQTGHKYLAVFAREMTLAVFRSHCEKLPNVYSNVTDTYCIDFSDENDFNARYTVQLDLSPFGTFIVLSYFMAL